MADQTTEQTTCEKVAEVMPEPTAENVENLKSTQEEVKECETATEKNKDADTTEEKEATGTKRKQDEVDDTTEAGGDDVKKVKPLTEEEKKEDEEGKGDSVVNGCTEKNGVSTEQTKEVIEPEIVAKTVEDVVKPAEDVTASS